MTRGSQPAFPQSVCPMLIYVGVDVSGGQGYQENVIEKHHGDNCPLCHGTGLVGGGMSLREWYIGMVASGYIDHVEVIRAELPVDVDRARDCIDLADAILARLNGEVGNG